MSLIIAIPTNEGVIISTDSHVKLGQVKQRVPKIHRLSSQICWSATGEYALIQHVGESLEAVQNTKQSLRELAGPIANIVKARVKDFLSTDFRTEMYINNLGAISQLHRAEFVFAEYRNGNSTLLHLSIVGSPHWFSQHPFIIGPGDIFAGALIKRYLEIELNLKLAAVLAYRLMEDTIETNIYGLEAPVDLWEINGDGVKQFQPDDLKLLADQVEALRQHELMVFEKHLTMTVSH